MSKTLRVSQIDLFNILTFSSRVDFLLTFGIYIYSKFLIKSMRRRKLPLHETSPRPSFTTKELKQERVRSVVINLGRTKGGLDPENSLSHGTP